MDSTKIFVFIIFLSLFFSCNKSDSDSVTNSESVDEITEKEGLILHDIGIIQLADHTPQQTATALAGGGSGAIYFVKNGVEHYITPTIEVTKVAKNSIKILYNS